MSALDVVNLDRCTPAALNMVWAKPKKEHDLIGISGTVYPFGLHAEPAARALGASPNPTTSQAIASVLPPDTRCGSHASMPRYSRSA